MAEKINGFINTVNNNVKININLLICLCFVTQHSFLVKLVSVSVLTFINLQNFRKDDFRRLPLFYALLIALEIVKLFFLEPDFSKARMLQFSVGLTYWTSSLIVCWIIYITVRYQKYITETLKLVTLINFAFSGYQIIAICLHEGVINPYNTGHNHPYGVSSGDLISGLFHGVHLTNAFVSIFLSLYFINRRDFFMAGLALVCLLLTGNNYATIVYGITSMVLMFLDSNKISKCFILSSYAAILCFFIFITPANAEYMIEKVLHISMTLPNSARNIAEENAENETGYHTINLPDTLNPYGAKEISGKKIVVKNNSKDTIFDFVKQSGKVRSFFQTKDFMLSSSDHFLFGAGMGRFSSKLAFNSSGVMEGSALARHLPKYESKYFVDNHKALYKYLKKMHVMFHSESNRPFSVYNQLLGEYGFIGFVFFIVFYLIYFLKRIKLKNSFAFPLFMCLILVINIDYFFESLSVFLFFETLMFESLKNKETLQ